MKFNLKHYFLLISTILLFQVTVSKAQNSGLVKGVILDNEDNKPVAYATVFLLKAQIGTITDPDGVFVIKPDVIYPKDTLFISHVGYNILFVPIGNTKDTITIKLIKRSLTLGEVLIKPLSPTDIIRTAIMKIPENYPVSPSNLTGYFTEYITENLKHIQFIEAYVNVYKSGYYGKNEKDRMKLTWAKERKNITQSEVWNYIKFVNGPFEILESDIVKYKNKYWGLPNNNILFINEKHFKYYNYSLWETTGIKGYDGDVYYIKFEPNLRRGAIYQGEMYISKKDFAFVKISYSVISQRINQILLTDNETTELLKLDNIFIEPKGFYSEISYRPYNNKWHLYNAELSYQMQMFRWGSDIDSYLSVTEDFWITGIEDKNVMEIPYSESVKRGRSLNEQIKKVKNTETFNYKLPIFPK